MKIRSFLAFELPIEIKEIVARVSGEIRRYHLDVRWVKVDNIHLTVVFMGDIHTEELKSIKERVKKSCFKYAPFEISLQGVGFFPNRRNPQVLWLGLNGALERISFFRNSLQKGLKSFGVKQEKRRFKPHLTLGRFRKSKGRDSLPDELITRYKYPASPICPLNELVLFKSELQPGGAVHTKLESWRLTGKK